jgi:hypothetical protein
MKAFEYHTPGGECIDTTARNMVSLAKQIGGSVRGEHNGVKLKAGPTTKPASIVRFHRRELNRKHQDYLKSPAYKRDQEWARKREESDRRRQLMFEGALAFAPPKMTIKDEARYKAIVSINGRNSLGRTIINFAESWARLMEARTAKGDTASPNVPRRLLVSPIAAP